MKQTSPRLIGAFVIGGILLLVAALLLFSAQDLFTPKRKFVAYFEQSVNGLNVGAPVRFRGIPIGEVLMIEGIFNPESGTMIPRLTLEVRPETMVNAVLREGDYTLFPILVKRGMRASLESASLLTGQLYVSLDFHPDEPPRQLGGGKDEYPEMPTIESGLNETIAKLSELPLQELLVSATNTLMAAEDLLRNPDIGRSIAALPSLLTGTDAAIGDLRSLLNNQVPGLLANTNTAVSDIRHYINGDLNSTTRILNETLEGAGGSLQTLATTLNDKSLVQAQTTMNEFDKTLQLVQQRLSRDDALNRELLTTLREMGGAARSMRELADNLKRHPETLIRGKSQ
jgi:paraquat-inducible protein B